MQLHIIREGDGHGEAYFSRFLVEDRYEMCFLAAIVKFLIFFLIQG